MEGIFYEEKRKLDYCNDKKTYLLLAIAACIILYLVKAAISTFALKTMLMEDFLGELMVCVLIALSCIYLFVRFNTYSHLYNPDHPKPGDKV